MKTIQLPGDAHRKPDHVGKHEQEGTPRNENITCESALREAGVDERLIAKKLKEQLEAKQPRWNPKRNVFQLFPDHSTRLAALREILRLFGAYPSEDEEGQGNITLIMDGITPKKPRDDVRDVGERSERSSPDVDEHRAGPNGPR